MKQVARKQVINYRWWRADGKEIKKEHIGALEESAEERIAEMRTKGFTSGDLHDNVHMTDDDPEDGIEYTGWWDITTTVTN